MVFNSGEAVPISDRLIAPRAGGEIAFILKKDLTGPGITNADVLAATECVMPCFEIVDSRIQDWKIAIQDTIADNASCGLFVLGDNAVSPRDIDLVTCGVVVEKNGSIISTGAGAAALSSPVNCVAWLANTLGEYGISLNAGEGILSGSRGPLEPVKAADTMRVHIGGMGRSCVRVARPGPKEDKFTRMTRNAGNSAAANLCTHLMVKSPRNRKNIEMRGMV